MLRMMRKMIQHEYVFLYKLEMLKHHVIWCIYLFGKSNHHFYWKVYHHPKGPLFLIWWQRLPGYVYGSPLVLCTSILQRCCCSKCDGHFGQLKKIAFVLSRIKTPRKQKNGNGRMVQWDCLPLFCSFVVHSNVPLLSHQRFSDDVAGVSPAAMEEWTQWMRKKKSCSALVWPSIRAKIQPWFDPQLIIVILFFVTFKGLISRGGGGRFKWQDRSTTPFPTTEAFIFPVP